MISQISFMTFIMAAEVNIDSEHDVSIYTCHRNYPDKSKLAVYKPLLHYFKQLQLSNKTEHFSF